MTYLALTALLTLPAVALALKLGALGALFRRLS